VDASSTVHLLSSPWIAIATPSHPSSSTFTRMRERRLERGISLSIGHRAVLRQPFYVRSIKVPSHWLTGPINWAYKYWICYFRSLGSTAR
jgi:hypothetical protein